MISRRSAAAAAVLGAIAVGAVAGPASVAQTTPLAVWGAFATQIAEPWDGVIHSALQAEEDAGRISYDFTDDIGYSGDMERVLREIAEQQHPAIIFGDAFGNEEAARAVAADYLDIAFAFGSEGGPTNPNFSTFDNWIHEPAYLAGMLAGGLTKSNVIGVVGAIPIPEVNRLANAFIAGAQLVNPAVVVKVSFIGSFFDPAAANEAAVAQIGAGADVLYAERAGVIEAAATAGILAIGNMSDQQALAPANVVTSVTWNMTPTVDYVVGQVEAGAFTAQDLKDFSMVGKGGAALAPINSAVTGGVPQALVDQVIAKQTDIQTGRARVDINESAPAGTVSLPQ